MCTSSNITNDTVAITIIFRALGFVGFCVSLYLIYRLYKDMKKGK